VGDRIPDVALDRGFPPETFPLRPFCDGRKVIIVGLPGAFTFDRFSMQVKGYLERQEELRAKGVTDVLFYSVNDGAVMNAWARNQSVGPDSIVTVLADTRCELTQALGLALELPAFGDPRCRRFSMLVDDGVVKTLHVSEEEDADVEALGGGEPNVTFVERMLEDL